MHMSVCVLVNLPAIQVTESDLADAVSRGGDINHTGEITRCPTVLQCVQEQPGQQEVA